MDIPEALKIYLHDFGNAKKLPVECQLTKQKKKRLTFVIHASAF